MLIAGDLFHRQPLLRELREVCALFSRIPRTEVVISAGNHDHMKNDSYYRTFEWPENVHMILEDRLTGIELPQIETAVYGFSYHGREICEKPYADQKAPRRQKTEILMIHGGDEKHVPVKKEELAELGYDYVALGHIHKPQMLLPGKAAWCGALEPTDKNDIGDHGYISGEISDGRCRIVFVPFAQRSYIHQNIEVKRKMSGYELKEALRRSIEENGVQNIYKIILKGERNPDTVFDLQAFDTYGNIIEIIDHTVPAYNYEKLMKDNEDNILGQLIRKWKDCDEHSVEYHAMCEGVQALIETRRG